MILVNPAEAYLGSCLFCHHAIMPETSIQLDTGEYFRYSVGRSGLLENE